MTEALQAEERGLLARLTGLEAEASGHRIKLEGIEEEIVGIKTELNGIRENLLDDFLFARLSPKLITYVIKYAPSGEIRLSLSAAAGGELAFDKLKSQLGSPDMSDVPLFHVLAYLGEGTPWTTSELNAYATA